MHEACWRRDYQAARAIDDRLSPLVAALELDTNPVAVKYAMHILRGLNPDVRLPLVELLPYTADLVRKATLVLGENDCDAARSRVWPQARAEGLAEYRGG
jgi:4-hydroxy-tetrahydrodipicolinate synthase